MTNKFCMQNIEKNTVKPSHQQLKELDYIIQNNYEKKEIKTMKTLIKILSILLLISCIFDVIAFVMEFKKNYIIIKPRKDEEDK